LKAGFQPTIHSLKLESTPALIEIHSLSSRINSDKIGTLPDSAELGRLCVVLVSTRNPLNIGAAARAMSNFGFSNLRVVNPYEPSFREARSAVGAADLLAHARQYQTVAEAVADCQLVVGTTAVGHRDLQSPLKPLAQGAELMRVQLATGRVALLFGSEKVGLSNDDLSHCHWLLRIPTREEHGSMNLGQAVAVCLYELARDEGPMQGSIPATSATAAELELLTTLLTEALQASGYVNLRPVALMEEKVRRLIHRLNVTAADAEILLGMLRQILWKLKSDK
jgi:TrmH family RNA methyltransferase